MKTLNLVGLSLATVLALVGCGSSGGGADDPKTGTGYYVDSAVGGLSYVCGTQTGTTAEDGKFTFEVGQSCLFKVGDIELPVVEASELKDGAKFVEDDAKTTQFLQSLDDASDGKITITPELVKALKEKDIVIVPDDAGLKELVKGMEASAKDDATFTFTGYYVTPEEAASHVAETKESVAGEAAAEGVAFTFPSKLYADVELDTDYYNGKNHEQFEAEVFEFTADKKFKHSEVVFKDGAFVLDTNDNDNDNDTDYVLENGKWVEDKDDKQFPTVVSAKDTLVTLDDKYQLSMKSIKDLEGKSRIIRDSDISVTMPKDAKEIEVGFKVLKEMYEIHQQARTYGNTNNEYYTSLTDVVENKCGTHYFTHAKDNSGINGISFACGQENQTSGTMVGVKNDNSLVTTGVGTWEIKTLPNSDIKALLVNIDTKYNEHSDSPMYAMKDAEVWRGHHDTVGEKEPMITYNKTAFDAFTAKIAELDGGGSSTETPIINTFKFTTDYLNGKTLYNVNEECDTHDDHGKCTETNPPWEMAVFTFTTTTLSAYKDATPNEKITDVPYTITEEGYIKFIIDNAEYIKALEVTNDFIRLDWTDREESLNTDRYNDYFYFDETKARAFLAQQNK
jgi:hypothetical protein